MSLSGRQVIGILSAVLLAAALVLILSVLGLLAAILVFLGLALFVILLVLVLGFVILSIILVPYYFITRRPKVEPGRYELREIKEK